MGNNSTVMVREVFMIRAPSHDDPKKGVVEFITTNDVRDGFIHIVVVDNDDEHAKDARGPEFLRLTLSLSHTHQRLHCDQNRNVSVVG